LGFNKEAMDLYVRHIGLLVVFESYTPKHHLLFHLLQKSDFHGNPSYYATWLDESLNKTLKSACKNACSAIFEGSTLLRMRELLKEAPAFKRDRQSR
jgi:hypothetical protein